MTPADFRYGFRVLGPATEPRRLIDFGAAFAAYAAADAKAECAREAYLSAFTFAGDFGAHLGTTRSTAGFVGPCWGPFVWFDLDSDQLDTALDAGRRLVVALADAYGTADDDLLVFFSGCKGFHVGLPTALWKPEPGPLFHRTARRFAEHVAELAGVAIDSGVYDEVRLFRAPNSRHPKSLLYKRRLSVDELLHFGADRIRALAAVPEPFEIPTPPGTSATAAAAWHAAVEHVQREAEAKAERAATGNGAGRLNRGTLEFIRDGATTGDRHRLLYSAAANLAELGCPGPLAHELLTLAALDSGLSPSDARRQIECGLASVIPAVQNACRILGAEVIAVRHGAEGQAP